MMAATKKSDLPEIKITPISTKKCIRGFHCGEREIDGWAKDKAYKFNERGRAKVFVARGQTSDIGLGFYSLSFSTENSAKLAKPDDRDAWKDGAPLVYIDYIAVQHSHQGQGLGTMMLMDALRRANIVFHHVAFYGVALRSLNERTTVFYQKLGFGIAPNETSHPLMILPIWSALDLFSTV